jgi:toxin secretion/phage lysis holin
MEEFDMKEIWNGIQLAIAAVGGWLGWFLGGLDGLIYALIAFAAVDYVTGILRAVTEKNLSSRVGARGIAKKVAIFLLVGVAHLADAHLLGDGGALRTAVICFYLSNEGLSLLENTVAIGLPVPEKLRDVLAQLHGKSTEATTIDPTPTPVPPEPANPPTGQESTDPGIPQKPTQEDE